MVDGPERRGRTAEEDGVGAAQPNSIATSPATMVGAVSAETDAAALALDKRRFEAPYAAAVT